MNPAWVSRTNPPRTIQTNKKYPTNAQYNLPTWLRVKHFFLPLDMLKKCDAVRKLLEDFTGEGLRRNSKLCKCSRSAGNKNLHADSILSKDVKGILIFQSTQHVYTIVLPTWQHWKMHLRTHHNPPGDSDKWATTFTSWWVSYTKNGGVADFIGMENFVESDFLRLFGGWNSSYSYRNQFVAACLIWFLCKINIYIWSYNWMLSMFVFFVWTLGSVANWRTRTLHSSK